MTDVCFTIKELNAFRLTEIILLNLTSVAKTFSARQIFPSLDIKIRRTCFSFLVGSITFKQQSNFLIVLFCVNAVITSALVCFHRNKNEAKLYFYIFSYAFAYFHFQICITMKMVMFEQINEITSVYSNGLLST